MRIMRLGPVFVVSLLFSGVPIQAQQSSSSTTPTRDPQALTILVRCLQAAGGPQALSGLQDFSATGTITYYWAGQKVSGAAKVRARGIDQFSLESNLPEGNRYLILNHGRGRLRESDGKVSDIPFRNSINLGILSFPYPVIIAALNDPLTSITTATADEFASTTNLAPVQPPQGHIDRIRVQRPWPGDSSGSLSKLTVTVYSVDTDSGLVVQVNDATHSLMIPGRDYPHEIDLGQYERINGVSIPMDVSEKVNGQLLWELHLDTVNFNVGLSDSDFDLK